jgi:hypothetical protein
MALIGNPMDFDRIRQKYESLVYPRGRTQDNYFNNVRSNAMGLLGNQGQVDPLTGQPINMSALTAGGFNAMSQNATAPGQQVQFRLNPQTGATEAVIPEYMGGFRTDQQDFLPSTGGFETIYDAGLGQIDPNTGQVKPDPVIESTIGQTIPVQAMGGGDGRNRNQPSPVTHEVINGVAYRINTATGAVNMLDGIDATIAKTLNNFVSNPFTVAGLLNTITGNANKSYHEKMQDLKEVNEDAYNELALNVKEQYAVQQKEEEDKPFNIVDEVSSFFTGLFAGDDKGDGKPDTSSKPDTTGGFQSDDAGGYQQGPGGQGGSQNNNTSSGGSPFGGSSSGGPPGTGSEAGGGNNTGGGGGFQGGANPMGGGYTGGR